MRTILLLSGTAPPAVATAGGGLSLSGAAPSGVGVVGGGGLTLAGTAAAVPGVAGDGVLTFSGSAVVGVVVAASGGLTLAGPALVVPGTVGIGGFALAGSSDVAQPAGPPQVAVAAGGLSLSGRAAVVVRVVGSGGFSLSGSAAVAGSSTPTPTPAPRGYRRYPGYFTSYLGAWRTSYFPGSSGWPVGGLTGDTITLPGTFLAAVRATLRADATLAGLLRGGVWHRVAPPKTPEPLLVFIVPAIDRAPSTTSRDYIEQGQLQLSIYGPKDDVAVAAANRAVAALTDATLIWRTGATFYLRPSDPASPGPPRPGYGGSRVFGEVRVLDFKNYGNFAVG